MWFQRVPHRAGFSMFPRKCRWIKPPDVNDWGVDSTTLVVAWVLGEFPTQTQIRNGRGRSLATGVRLLASDTWFQGSTN